MSGTNREPPPDPRTVLALVIFYMKHDPEGFRKEIGAAAQAFADSVRVAALGRKEYRGR